MSLSGASDNLGLLIFADALLAFGLFLMIRANLVLMPIDLFVNALQMKTGRKWGNVNAILVGQYVKLYTFIYKKLFSKKTSASIADVTAAPVTAVES